MEENPQRGPSQQHTWKPETSGASITAGGYWWNWRFLLCSLWVCAYMTAASISMWRHESRKKQDWQGGGRDLHEDESWRPCLGHLHPAWLLGFRVVAFLLLSAMLVGYVSMQGAQTFFYYTQWTFLLVVVYFGLGSMLSIYGCHQFLKKENGNCVGQVRQDEEQDAYEAPTNGASIRPTGTKEYTLHEEHQSCRTAGIWGYVFQIIYQINAGAIMLTDCVFWMVIVPFLEKHDYHLNMLMIGMHSINLVFLLADASMNSLRFPWFRISYFIMWTAIYVLFLWIVHACITIWWPYPFLDFSSQYSPIWYFLLALMHIPCYAIFFFIVKLKHWVLSRSFPHSYLM